MGRQVESVLRTATDGLDIDSPLVKRGSVRQQVVRLPMRAFSRSEFSPTLDPPFAYRSRENQEPWKRKQDYKLRSDANFLPGFFVAKGGRARLERVGETFFESRSASK